MTSRTSSDLTTLDFSTLRANFITYMKSQVEFRDYDFDASNLSVLIDLLAYNSHLNGFFTNMNLSEGFLDSAQLKSSLISHAKDLNYTPASAHSAKGTVHLTFSSPDASVLLQKGQTMSATIKSKTYTFSIEDNQVMAGSNNNFSANVIVAEGPYVTDTYVVNSSDETQRFALTNESADTTSLSVVIFEDGNLTGIPFKKATTLLGLNESSKVFFLHQTEVEKFEVMFGDNVVGRRPKDGAVIVLDYRITLGSAGNGAKLFVPNFNPGGNASDVVVDTLSASDGGADPEEIESIRFRAPRHFQVQEQGVAEGDYEVLLQEQFPEIQAVSAYGGETLDPPQFGRVFVAVQITGVDGLPESRADAYHDFLKPRSSKTVTPVIVAADNSYVLVDTIVNYDLNATTLTPESLRVLILNAVIQFSHDHLGIFAAVLRASRLGAAIDGADDSIFGNETGLRIYKKISPRFGASPVLTSLKFGMSMFKGDSADPGTNHTISSTPFVVGGTTFFLEDDAAGGIFLSDGSMFSSRVGTVNYATGEVTLTALRADSYTGNSIRVFAKLEDHLGSTDIATTQSTILSIEPDAVTITFN